MFSKNEDKMFQTAKENQATNVMPPDFDQTKETWRKETNE